MRVGNFLVQFRRMRSRGVDTSDNNVLIRQKDGAEKNEDRERPLEIRE